MLISNATGTDLLEAAPPPPPTTALLPPPPEIALLPGPPLDEAAGAAVIGMVAEAEADETEIREVEVMGVMVAGDEAVPPRSADGV